MALKSWDTGDSTFMSSIMLKVIRTIIGIIIIIIIVFAITVDTTYIIKKTKMKMKSSSLLSQKEIMVIAAEMNIAVICNNSIYLLKLSSISGSGELSQFVLLFLFILFNTIYTVNNTTKKVLFNDHHVLMSHHIITWFETCF